MLSAVDSKMRMEMGSEKMLAGILEPLRGLYDYVNSRYLSIARNVDD